ncbi:MAG: phosphopantothenoylcysteine decarboxylase, partial [Planctomycetales bacterium]|nr:phosphopantothenoylcysteine decarboxylase [Planctomycetales bacterium]
RYLTNASSGRMGRALAIAALEAGHDVVVVSGPIDIEYPAAADVLYVETTEEMLKRCEVEFQLCDGVIGAAAPCDYRPVRIEPQKIAKTGDPLVLHLIETPDVVATLGASKAPDQWVIGFALETEDPRFRALAKMQRKNCDLMVVNGPDAINSAENSVEVMLPDGQVIAQFSGGKQAVAHGILDVVQQRLIVPFSKGLGPR